jgi:cell division protein ZapD
LEKRVIYEQPLNERVRSFLRLEHLFNIADHHRPQDSQWDSRIAISCLLEILDLITRSDLKSDLIKELEKHTITLDVLKNNPNVDHQRLNDILSNINDYLNTLRDSEFQPGQRLKNDELITSIKQRISIPGGTCNFDLPAFHHWLHKSAQSRHDDLDSWRQDLLVIQESLTIALLMLRNSTTPVIENAESGFYQQPIESKLPCQLLRVFLPEDCNYFPEISGGKHRFTIRFMEQSSTSSRPVQTSNAVEFELHCCIL